MEHHVFMQEWIPLIEENCNFKERKLISKILMH